MINVISFFRVKEANNGFALANANHELLIVIMRILFKDSDPTITSCLTIIDSNTILLFQFCKVGNIFSKLIIISRIL